MDNSIFEPISEDVISSIMEAPGDENEGGNDNNVDLAADDNTNNDNQNADDNNADNDTDENNDQDQEIRMMRIEEIRRMMITSI